MRFFILLTTITVAAAATLEFNIDFVPKPECDAGDTVDGKGGVKASTTGNNKYEVKEAYIYWTDNEGKILGIAVCKVPRSKTCDGERVWPKGSAKSYLALAVTLRKSSFEDQNIHYQYFDELFGLSLHDEPSNSKPNDIHNLNNFLFANSAKYETPGGTLNFSGGDCRRNRAKSLISGHGYFITEFKSHTDAASWENLYYLPHRIGQYIRTPN